MANRSGGTPTPTASWAFPPSLASRQPPRNRPPAVLDMSEFPALGTTPPASTSSASNSMAHTIASHPTTNGGQNDHASNTTLAAALLGGSATNGSSMTHGLNFGSTTGVSSHLNHSMAMLTGQSIPAAAAAVVAAAATTTTTTMPPSSATGSSTSTRKTGEFTLEDFPALGVSQPTTSTSSTSTPNHSMAKSIDRSQGSTPATPHDTPTAAMVARRVNGINGVVDEDTNGTHANGAWSTIDPHMTMASRIMAANHAAHQNASTPNNTASPRDKSSVGTDLSNSTIVTSSSSPSSSPSSVSLAAATDIVLNNYNQNASLGTVESNHMHNQLQNTLSHPNATSSLLASLTAAAISSTPSAHPPNYLPTSSHEHLASSQQLQLQQQLQQQQQQQHPLGALPAAPLVPPTPGLINNHPTHNTLASAHSMGTSLAAATAPTAAATAATATATTTIPPNSNSGSHSVSSQFSMGMPSDPTQRWRLLALRDVIRSNGDLTMLHLGSDLTNLGINLNLGDPLYATVTSTVTEPCQLPVEPDYRLPPCYIVQPAPPAQQKMSVFSEETLFYIFYAMPQDVLQDAAAQELYNRHWRYHKEHGVWLTKDATALDSIQRTATHERGRFIIFDHHHWQRVTKETVIAYDALEERGAANQHPPNMLHGAVANATAIIPSPSSNIATSTATATATTAINNNASNMNLLGHNPLMQTPHASLMGLFGSITGPSNHGNNPSLVMPPSTPSNNMNTITTNGTANTTPPPSSSTTTTTASSTASVSAIATIPAALVATAPMANEVVNTNNN